MTISYDVRFYSYVDSADKLEGALTGLLDSAKKEMTRRKLPKLTLGFDTETYGTCEVDKKSPYKPGLDPFMTNIRLMQFSTGKYHLIVDVLKMTPEELEPIFKVLQDKEILKVIHNAKFDFSQVFVMFGVEVNNFYCTMAGSQILACGIPCSHKLKDVAGRYLGVELDKAEQTSDWSADPLSKEQLDYASADTQVLVDLYVEQRKRLAAMDMFRVAKLEFDCLKAAAWTELSGFYLSPDKWREVYTGKAKLREQLREELTDALDQGGWRPEVNLNSGAQLIAGLKLFGVEVASAATAKLQEHVGHPLVNEILAYKEALSGHKKLVKQGYSEDSTEFMDSMRFVSQMADSVASQIAEKMPRERIDLNSPKQVLTALQGFGERNGIEELVALPGTNEKDHLDPLKGIELISQLLLYREYSKAEDTYGESFLRYIHPASGRIHSTFNTLRADTGRMSGSSPNLQNIPREDAYRACFIVPDKHWAWTGRKFELIETPTKLITLDYSQIEPRILAQLANDPAFHAVFTSGEDLYVTAARLMFGDSTIEKKDPRRAVAKALMLGLFYGKGAGSLAKEIGVEKDVAKGYIKVFADRFPIVWKWLNDSAKSAVMKRETRTMMGRLRRFRLMDVTDAHIREFYGPNRWNLRDEEEYDEAFKKIGSVERQGKNTPIQGTSADITKLAAVYLYNEYRWSDVALVNIVHDEFVLEVPTPKVEVVTKRAEELMIAAAQVFITDVPIKVGIGIDDRWAKD